MSNIKQKIRNLIREGLCMSLLLLLLLNILTLNIADITNDNKIMMKYEKYEKLIVFVHGVELINWPKDIPFVNPSDIPSFTGLEKLHMALTHSDLEYRCRWVKLDEDDWTERRKVISDGAFQQSLPAKKRPREQSKDTAQSETRENAVISETSKRMRLLAQGKENIPANSHSTITPPIMAPPSNVTTAPPSATIPLSNVDPPSTSRTPTSTALPPLTPAWLPTADTSITPSQITASVFPITFPLTRPNFVPGANFSPLPINTPSGLMFPKHLSNIDPSLH